MNTPQFSWVKNKMPRKPQPVPPIYQPEVAARAIYWAAHHGRREIYVGRSSVKAIVGNKIAPDFADHMLAKKGYKSQQHDGRDDPTRPDNLWNPVEGDRGAHGEFDSRAEEYSVQLFAARHKLLLGLSALAFAAGMLTAKKPRKSKFESWRELLAA